MAWQDGAANSHTEASSLCQDVVNADRQIHICTQICNLLTRKEGNTDEHTHRGAAACSRSNEERDTGTGTETCQLQHEIVFTEVLGEGDLVFAGSGRDG